MGSQPHSTEGTVSAQFRKYASLDRNHPVQVAVYTSAATGTMLRKAGIPSLRIPPLIQPWIPAIRRALRSQKTVSSPNPARKNSADHLVPTANPRHTPAASRHQRIPSQGPDAS